MLVNLFDDTFRHDTCSVAWKTPEHIEYVRDKMEFDGVTLFTDGYVNKLELIEQVETDIKIGWLREPKCLHPENYEGESILDFIVLTYDSELIREGCTFCPYGGIWIEQKDWQIRPKNRFLSMLYGSKTATEGHQLRHEIGENLSPHLIQYFGYQGIPTDYSVQTKMRVLDDYLFSIVIETCREDNLFTEILLDCFVLGTGPIFWGAPNIGDFFNTDGILSFETIDELEGIVRTLNRPLYDSMLEAIEENFYLAQEYAITEDWIYLNVLKELE